MTRAMSMRSSPVLGPAADGHGLVVRRRRQRHPLRPRRRDGQAPLVVRHHLARPDPARPQRPQRSPALGRTGVYIGGEDGYLHYVPYDYCLHRADSRCDTSPGQAFARRLDTACSRSAPAGTCCRAATDSTLPDSTTLVVAARGAAAAAPRPTLDAAACRTRRASCDAVPPFPFQRRALGRRPLPVRRARHLPRAGDRLHAELAGPYAAAALRDRPADGRRHRRRDRSATRSASASRPAAGSCRACRPGAAGHVGVPSSLRLAVPLPPFLPSVNQIGFDSLRPDRRYRSRSRAPARAGWGSSSCGFRAAAGTARGRLVADPRASLAFPIGGTYRGNEFILSGRNLDLTFSFGDVPLDRFDLRGRMGADRRVKPGASLYAEAICAKVPNYGPVLAVATRLCNRTASWWRAGPT